ncbi:hypothetical protein OF83DRAFT_1088614 [Amylostereum chailletii]|nr:hypothetical protein OF83DRAFT_1088614 [Amylostereum chailletii]
MSTAAAAAPPLSPFPPSPHKPNPHPYAIKTTSTGVLSRSNSSGHATPSTRHHYVPPPPRSPKRTSKERSSEYRGHRYSKSLTGSDIDFPPSPSPSESAQPLPGPPSPTRSQRSISEDGASIGSPHRRTKRADTLPSLRLSETGTDTGDDEGVGLGLGLGIGLLGGEDLPSNPKTWTPSQLSTYLVTALRVRGADTSSAPIAAPVARDIAAWVRKESITGRTFLRWRAEDLELLGINTLWRTALLNAARNLRQNVLRGRIWGTSPPGSPSPPASPSPAHPFSSDLYASSSSSVDLSHISTSPRRRLRARGVGRVKGLVDKWEKESAGSESDADSPTKLSFDLPPTQENDTVRVALPPPPAHAPTNEEDEPSMEELLAAMPEASTGSWGARAWEAMDVGATVKHIGEQETGDTVVVRREGSGSGSSGKRLGSSGRVKTNGGADRRIVTAVFVPSAMTAEEERAHGETGAIADAKEKEEVIERLESVLEREVRGSREMLEAFRRRLEEVEARVREMEADEDTGVRAFDARLAAVEARYQATLEEERRRWETERTALEAMLTAAHATPPESTPESSSETHERRDDPDDAIAESSRQGSARFVPPSVVSDLPSYVLLVGLGVCAVVFKVVLRRVVAGRKS